MGTNKKSLILVNTGEGKGKTSAALGVVMRALGQGYKVAVIQFIKNTASGEFHFLEEYASRHPGRLFYRMLGAGFITPDDLAEDRAKAWEALELAVKLSREDYDLLVMDEICVAMDLSLIEVKDVVNLLENRQPNQNIILTGRGCPQAIIDLADTVTEMHMVKHAYQKGINAKRGIEF